MTDLLAELRRRLGLSVSQAPDVLLQHFLDVATSVLAPWLVDDPAAYQASVDEATVQLAVKLWDTSTQGVSGSSASGDWYMPAPSATPGLVRSVFGALGPALKTGGLSV